nr:hypothetical protein [uncultured Ruminococcus sp.]
MSADFTTTITVKGTNDDYLRVLEVLRLFTNERYKQYQEKKDCWYLSGNEIQNVDLDKYVKGSIMTVILDGPYGVINGPIGDCVDFFERIADVIPGCWFRGSISGWDAGGNQSIDAELRDGLLFLKSEYGEFREEESEENVGDVWDTVYDPKTKRYSDTAWSGDFGGDSFYTIRLVSDKGEGAYFFDEPFDLFDKNNLESLKNISTVSEFISFFGISKERELFSTKDYSLDDLTLEDIKALRYTEGEMLYDEEAESYLEEIGIDPDDYDPQSEEAEEFAFNDMDDLVVGQAFVYDMKTGTIRKVPIDSDDGIIVA